MRIFLKTLTGKTIIIYVESNWSVNQLKEALQYNEGFPVRLQRLIFCGKQLEDGRTLDEYKIKEDSTLHIILRLKVSVPGDSGLAYLNMTKSSVESEEAKLYLTLDERTFLTGKCAEMSFWVKHDKQRNYLEISKKIDPIKRECEPILIKLAKHKLRAHALDVKEKMESEKVGKVSTLDKRASLVGKCTEVLFWLNEQPEDKHLTDEDKEEIDKRRMEIGRVYGPIFFKLKAREKNESSDKEE